MNPTKADLVAAISDGFDVVTGNTGELTNEECVECYNKILEVLASVDPSKGKPDVKQVVSFG